MRRYVAALAVVAMPFAVGSCEDGPNQTYSPAPPNAGGIWNGSPGAGGLGDGGAFVPPARQGYDAGVGGTNANDLCTPSTEKAVWGTLFSEPIAPPGLVGGIDMAGGPKGDGASGYGGGCSSTNVGACTMSPPAYTYDPTKETWSGATVEQVEAFLCQGVATDTFFGYSDEVGWGENTEVRATYNTSNREIFWINIVYGYNGTLSGTMCDSSKGMCGTAAAPIDGSGDSYSLSMQNIPTTYTKKGGMPQQQLLDWSNKTALYQFVNGFYESLRYTYDSAYPAAGGATATAPGSCVNTGDCQVFDDGASGGGLYFTPLGILIYYQTTVGTPQANSIPIIVQMILQKLLPFSLSSNMAKLDVEGPTAITTNVYQTGHDCKYTLGQDFGSFNSACVRVYSPDSDTRNDQETAKLFGAMSHSDEAYQFNIQGVDPQFVASSLPATSVIADGQKPQNSDLSYELDWDQQLLGKIDNDYTANDPTQPQDLHGYGMIALEWANNVQHYMQKAYGVNTELGEPACLTTTFGGVSYTNTTSHPGPSIIGQPVAGMPTSPVKCSGLEGITTTAPSNFVQFPQQKVNALGTGATLAGPGNPVAGSLMSPGMHPGTWYQLFCNDAGGLSLGVPNGYQDCIGGSAGFQNQASYYFDTMQDAVLQTGNWGTVLAQMPQRDLGNRRFFFQQWMLAMIKYLQVAAIADGTSATYGTPPLPGLQFVDSQPIDANSLFFDTAGQSGTGFENAEYVFRGNVNSAMQPPTDFTITAELLAGAVDEYDWGRYNFRGEKAAYTALTTTPGDLPGAENLYLSNMAGSPLLQSTYTSYACAINTDATNANCIPTGGTQAITGPVDALGNAVLTGYAPAFGQSVFAVGKPSAFTIDTSGASMGKNFRLLESAYVTIPVWSNPYDPTSATPQDKTISVLLPYLPSGAYPAGFPVTIDGSRDKWYPTNQFDLSGETLSGTVDFENVPTALADGGVQDQWVIRALESQNYTGLGFFCSQTDPTTGEPDLLYVRMYDLAADLLGYIEKYPAATTACNIQLKYSIYGNYADYISSLTNGVRFGLNPGFGGAVVSDLTIFDPSIVPLLGQ